MVSWNDGEPSPGRQRPKSTACAKQLLADFGFPMTKTVVATTIAEAQVIAEELGLNHTTISRRINALERSVGGRVLARVVSWSRPASRSSVSRVS